jgi:IS605 OrfB family transposase
LDDLVWGRWQDAIEDEVEKASHRAVEYASRFENSVIVLEYLDGITDEDIGKHWNRRLGKWLFSQRQSRTEDKPAEHGIAVEYVHPHHTSKTCHACCWVSTASSHVQLYERGVLGVGVPSGSERSSEQSQSAESVREPALEIGRR